MNTLLMIAGIILLVLVAVDILTTILQTEGGGIVSTRFSEMIWATIFFLAGKNARSPLMRYAGLTIISSLLLAWIMLLWLSYSLIFIAVPDSVVLPFPDQGNGTTIWQRIYYVGYTITSLGPGTLKAGNDFWRIITNFMGITGTIFLTLSISYIIPVVQAVTKMRTLAAYIHQMGNSPDDILVKHYKNGSFESIYDHLKNLQIMILEHAERHLAYPVLHYFHPTNPRYSVAINLAILEEATVLQELYNMDQGVQSFNWQNVRNSMDNYLDNLGRHPINTAENEPTFDYHERIKERIPTLNDPQQPTEAMQERRKKFISLIRKGGWKWEDVVNREI